MTLFGFELKKLFCLPALWVFMTLCLFLNIMLIFSNAFNLEFFNYTSVTAADLSQHVDKSFVTALSRMPQTENRDILMNAVAGMTDELETYDTATLSGYYQEQVASSAAASKWLQWKYSKLEASVAELAAADAATSLYAGPVTHDSHQFLFGTLLRAISAESMILGALAALYLCGYEHLTKTETLICATRKGRKLWIVKTCAGVAGSTMTFLTLAVVSLGVYFTVWDYSGIWGANVSSQFNYIQEIFMVKPFLTWGSFTVAGYLAASLVMIAALTVISCLAASALGILVRNAYAAALLLVLLCAGGISLSIAFANAGLWAAHEITNLQPAILWLTQNNWFTESGVNTVVPWQENIVSAMWIVLFGVGTALSLRRFNRKDIV